MYAPVDKASYWEDKYKSNQTNWDTSSENPVFSDFLVNSEFAKPGKILITGCGKGYDAVAAARNGYDVTAVDFSSAAINFAKQLAVESKVDIKFLNEDIFSLDNFYKNYFDYVFEYTTYCAINPMRRKEFAEKISSYIKNKGRLITVLFPVDNREGGPPFKIDVQEFYQNFKQYLQLEFSSRQINSIKPRKGKEILQVYYKK